MRHVSNGSVEPFPLFWMSIECMMPSTPAPSSKLIRSRKRFACSKIESMGISDGKLFAVFLRQQGHSRRHFWLDVGRYLLRPLPLRSGTPSRSRAWLCLDGKRASKHGATKTRFTASTSLFLPRTYSLLDQRQVILEKLRPSPLAVRRALALLHPECPAVGFNTFQRWVLPDVV